VSLESLSFPALGTECHLFLVGKDPRPLGRGADWVRGLHEQLTRFEPGSELSNFNSSAGRWTKVSPVLEALFHEALRAHNVSHGLVHAGVLNALLAAGYTRTFSMGPTRSTLQTQTLGPIPPLDTILEVGHGYARVRAGYGIDLGGIAKGWIADRLVEQLGENSLVNLGGDIFARGEGEDGRGWPVGFGGTTVFLHDQGAATSGSRSRRWGQSMHHLVDPRTGRPSRTDLEEVSVIATTGADAEIYAKTAFLMGREAAEYFLGEHCPGWWLYP
jgi:thiamine biosynthesis lipoprotein